MIWFFRCILYFLIMGILSFLVGRILPKSIFRFDKFPFAPFEFEENGKFYKKFKISRWQSRVPDMSRAFTKIMPPKRLSGTPDKETVILMIEETCIAEAVHFCLILSGIGYIFIWPGLGGRICFYLSVIINIIFIMIQRYNRPRLVSVYRKKFSSKNKVPENREVKNARTDTQLQYRRRS